MYALYGRRLRNPEVDDLENIRPPHIRSVFTSINENQKKIDCEAWTGDVPD